ncbi:MAG: AAA family ATPase, partial [Thermoanaerobaculia bacterium]
AAHAAIIRLLGAQGRRREALEHYDAVAVLFRRELGAALSGELESARHAVAAPERERQAAVQHPEGAATSLSEPPKIGSLASASPRTNSPSTSPEAQPFVGREDLVWAFDRWAESEETAPRFFLLVGEPGVGKTRVLAEVTTRFASRGEVLAGRAFLAERVRPFGSLMDALHTRPGRSHLSTLLPDRGTPAGEGDERSQFQAFERLLAERVKARGALLLCLDDAHWLDESTAGFLHYLLRSGALPGVLVLLTAREGELSENAAVARLVRSGASEGRLIEWLVPPMREDEIARLVANEVPGADARRVFTESEGNPLVALEIASALARGEEALSRSYDERLQDRFERLSAGARALLPWAAALGRTFSVDTLALACGLSPAPLLSALQELVDRGLLRAAGEGFDFTHDLIRRAAYRQLAEPSRPLLHREIARTLAARPDPDGLVASEVARHAALGGERELAGRAATAAGEACLRIFARRQAAELADIGLAAVRPLGPAERLPLELGLLAVHVGAAQRSPADLSRQVSRFIAEAADFPALKARALFLLAVLHYESGESSGAESAVRLAAEASQGADAFTRSFSLANAGRCLLYLERDVPIARVQLAEAHLLARTHALENPELPMGLGFDALFRGEHDEAVQYLEEGLALALHARDHWRACIFLVRLARLELERDRPEAARLRCDALRPMAEKMGEGSERAVCEALTALAEHAGGATGAEDRLGEAVQMLREADSKADLAFVQNHAAELEAGRRGGIPVRLSSAHARALEAFTAAGTIGLHSEQAVSRSLLAELAAAEGNLAAAEEFLADLLPELEIPDALSARAYEAVARAHETVAHARTKK